MANERVDALLRDIAHLRLTLDADLTVAAAAAEADRFDVAAEIVDFDRAELAAFAESAQEQLNAAETQTAVVPKQHKHKPPLRNRIALTAAPAMLAAAGVIAVAAITGGGANDNGMSRPQMMASYSALTALARSNDDPAQLVAIGSELNDSVAALIAAAAGDPAKAQQALRILEAEQMLLTRHHPNGGETLLAQARALVQRLQQTVPASVLTLAHPPAPIGTLSPPAGFSMLLPSAPASGQSQRAAPTRTPAPATHSAATSPPPQQPSPQPTTGFATVSPQPSPQPTAIDPWPFGTDGSHGNTGS
jgi:hypothetical protein